MPISELKREDIESRAALIGSGFVWAIPMSWFAQIVVLVVVAIAALDVVWRSHWTYQRHWGVRSALSAAVCIAVFLIGWRPVLAEYQKENESPDDLRATFEFPDRTQVGNRSIDFVATFFNNGKRPVQIKDISAFIAIMADKTGLAGTHLDKCDFPGLFPAALEGWFEPKTIGIGHKTDRNGILYYPFTSSAKGLEVPAGQIKPIAVTVGGVNTANSSYNVALVCPIVRYFDSDGKEQAVICRGFSVATESPIICSGTATVFGPSIPTAYRLLPHSAATECNAAEGP